MNPWMPIHRVTRRSGRQSRRLPRQADGHCLLRTLQTQARTHARKRARAHARAQKHTHRRTHRRARTCACLPMHWHAAMPCPCLHLHWQRCPARARAATRECTRATTPSASDRGSCYIPSSKLSSAFIITQRTYRSNRFTCPGPHLRAPTPGTYPRNRFHIHTSLLGGRERGKK